ncbi:indole-3-glycerol phosphate synthase TrpC [Niabella aurantiaca]|uniref:indole-3-glycerol phosphate synthase TrpC n=1 Tax=Niabella aurantiaca TaxID=379900 RepID=UPI00036DDFDD|nr:indole-3-glycerol phosphate synthase TrpC [Niabella aurantiaca]
MNILDTIIEHKRVEVAERKAQTSIEALERTEAFGYPVRSLAASLQQPGGTGIIAEFKRKSPSKGFINKDADVTAITEAYTNYGAAALSVLTDEHFFGGSSADLIAARRNGIPILRKDFIVDEYQILEAKAMGADIILLIAACLTPADVERLALFAASLGLETILELHAETELEHVCDATKIVGINNRDLKTFAVDLERSLKMAAKIPGDKIKIAESGIDKVEDILLFRRNGFRGFLIGEYFMRQEDPPKAFEAFVNRLNKEA